MSYNKCDLCDVEFGEIVNRNEARVLAQLPVVLAEYPDFSPNRLDYEDIYALALNRLPARYAQRVSLFADTSITDEMVQEAIRQAVQVVARNPNH